MLKRTGKNGQRAEYIDGVPVRADTQYGSVCRRDANGAQSVSVRGMIHQWGP